MKYERILGIDPGLCKTGWGILDKNGHKTTWVAHGIFQTKSTELLPERLYFLHTKIKETIELHQPNVLCIEEIFMNNNPSSTLKLGMARGAILMLAPLFNLPFFEYRPNYIKKSLTGNGHANKEQMMKMVQLLLSPKTHLTEDAADALAIAFCHSSHVVNY